MSVRFSELESLDFEIHDLNARVQYWREGEVYDYSLIKRIRSGLMYISDCDVEFEWNESADSGRGSLTAGRGSLIFLPQGMNYRATFHSIGNGESTYLANFVISGVELFHSIEKLSGDAHELAADFRELAALYIKPSTSPLCFRSRMYSLIWRAAALYNNEEKCRFGGIGAALRRMEELPTDVSEPELAALCKMSVPTFIRTVRLYTGMTPKQYSLSLRLAKAKTLLEGGMFTVSEIAELLGFASSSHFGAVFRKSEGVSPGEYAKVRAK